MISEGEKPFSGPTQKVMRSENGGVRGGAVGLVSPKRRVPGREDHFLSGGLRMILGRKSLPHCLRAEMVRELSLVVCCAERSFFSLSSPGKSQNSETLSSQPFSMIHSRRGNLGRAWARMRVGLGAGAQW